MGIKKTENTDAKADELQRLGRELLDTQNKIDHIVSAIPGGIAVYGIVDGRFVTEYYSEGVPGITGHTKEEYEKIVKYDALDIVFPADRERITSFAVSALSSKQNSEISYRIIHKNGSPVWVHLNFRFIETSPAEVKLFAVFMGMSDETRLFQSIANDSADGIYVIDKKNFDLFYVNEHDKMFVDPEKNAVGKKCYAALHGKSAPCEFCPLLGDEPYTKPHTVFLPETGRTYNLRFRDTDWYGLPAYVKYVSDVTEETGMKREKEKLEQYFRVMVKNLSGGVAVSYYDSGRGRFVPEFLSDGFAAMCGMTLSEAWEIYRDDAARGVHPDDADKVIGKMAENLKAKKDTTFELAYRLRKKDGSYFWVKNSTSIIYSADRSRIYSVFSDITNEVEEQERSRNYYNELLYRHHQTNDPDLLLAGHCNLTKRYIVRITDRNGNDIASFCGVERDEFFTYISTFIDDEKERKAFLDTFLTDKLLANFEKGTVKHEIDCFMKFPQASSPLYVHCTVNLMRSPDTGDVTGILSVVDHSERRVSDLILHKLIKNDYDFIAMLDIVSGEYSMLSYKDGISAMPDRKGSFADQVSRFLLSYVVPKDKAACTKKLDIGYVRQTLEANNSYSFHYSVYDSEGKTYDKNMAVFYIDKRLNKVCLTRTDITESVGEQRRLLNALTYAFEIVSFVDVSTSVLTVHTRKTLLGKLPPRVFDDLDGQTKFFADGYGTDESREEIRKQLSLATILKRLEESPQGYEFSFSCLPGASGDEGGEVRHKQVSIIWGDEYKRTVCMVHADVTDTVRKEHETREHLRSALMLANEANRAKTDFLSAMSHDIRTPMNAIVGMTELALSDRDNPAQIDESLAVIKSSSDHLLRLINEILDMSRIESGRLSLVNETFSHKTEFDKFIARSAATAAKKHIKFEHYFKVRHDDCVGDTVRLHQIFDNLVGNAVKFTPEGGTVCVGVEELPEKSEFIGCYRYTVSDTGIGMDKESVKRIFEPFYRSDDSVVRGTEGTGLGLSIVKSILDYKGGIIKVESEPGKGSKFVVDLPMHFASSPAPAAKAEPEHTEVHSLAGTRVLLVEDNPVNSLVAVKMLERVGVTVDTAENGDEGAKKFAACEVGTYDAICMDIQMPVMDGYEATRTIRTCGHPQAKSIPIIAMTANAFNSDVKRCMDAGMNAHISKPIIPDKLYSIMRTFVGGGVTTPVELNIGNK